MSSRSQITIPKHAADNWADRAPDDAISIRAAWQKAQSVGYVIDHFNQNDDHDDCTDVRLYHGVTRTGTEYTMLILERDGVLITTYPYDGATDHLVEAYLDKLEAATLYYESPDSPSTND